jgi:hypothetical protein
VAGAGSTFVVQNGGSATMIAGVKISFLPGTVVQPGGYLKGYITTNGTYCTNPANVPVNSGLSAENINDEDMPPSTNLFHVYPNPTPGIFTLKINAVTDGHPVEVTISTLMGQPVLNEKFTGISTVKLSLADQPAGIYLVKVICGDRRQVDKLIRL